MFAHRFRWVFVPMDNIFGRDQLVRPLVEVTHP